MRAPKIARLPPEHAGPHFYARRGPSRRPRSCRRRPAEGVDVGTRALAHPTLSHLGIQVATTQDVLAVRERWIESGLTVRDEMQTNCCFAIQDKSWVQDPDGNEWEVFVVLEDNLPEKNSSLCCGTETTGSSACSVPAPIGLGHKNKH